MYTLLNVHIVGAQLIPVFRLEPGLQVGTPRRQRQSETNPIVTGRNFPACFFTRNRDAGAIHWQGNAPAPRYPLFQRRSNAICPLFSLPFRYRLDGDLPERLRFPARQSPPESPRPPLRASGAV